MTTDTLERPLLSLPETDRSTLAELLVSSHHNNLGEDVDEAAVAHDWQVVAWRRADELRSCEVLSVPDEHVAVEVRRPLR